MSGVKVYPGETREIYLKVSESYLSASIQIPVTVIRGQRPGPTVFVMAAIHGDEINGADMVRRLIFDMNHQKLAGTLIAVPVVNIPGFLSESRYLPYHRDLNRFFPGRSKGNNADRMAHTIFEEIVKKCDFGIDLHTASKGRLNLPHVRGDMANPRVRNIARAFGTRILLDNPGVDGSLRKAATDAGVPTIIFEAGETGKFSKKISKAGLRGLMNVLAQLGMWQDHPAVAPDFQVIVKSSEWIRAQRGGMLELKVKPGELIYPGDIIGEIVNPFGKTVHRLRSSLTGIVIGVTTAPLTIPGTAVVHVARLRKTLARVEKALKAGKI